MSYTSDPADQIVRYSLEGSEVVLKLSGLAAKNFAMFAYTVLKDQKKTRGKTRLVRMLKEQKPLKFFTVPANRMREFAKEAKRHGLLFVPMRDKLHPDVVEITILAQDAAKVNRIMDRMCLDFVRAGAGEAVLEQTSEKDASGSVEAPVQTETVQTEQGAVDFVVGDFEDDFGIEKGDDENFTQGPAGAPSADQPERSNPFEPSSPSKSSSPMPSAEDKDVPAAGPETNRHSVREELREIRQEQTEKAKQRKQQRDRPAKQRTRSRKKKAKGR